MLTFVGLGLFDAGDISCKGLELVRSADRIFAEAYTSRLMGSSLAELGALYGKPVTLLSREDVEQHPEAVLEAARAERVVFLCAGDPMVSTTHADLRIRAAREGIATGLVHAASIQTAVCGLTGLQNYRFGKSCSLPFPQKNWFPTSPLDTIQGNLGRGLHTLVYLDIRNERYMTIAEAVALLERMAGDRGISLPLYVGVARAGSAEPVVKAGPAGVMQSHLFGPPLHILVIPAELHDMERTYLEMFAGL